LSGTGGTHHGDPERVMHPEDFAELVIAPKIEPKDAGEGNECFFYESVR